MTIPRVGKDLACLLPTVRVFEAFLSEFPTARHVSWLDVADLKWEGGDLWKEYRVHIREDMARLALLERIVARDRRFDEFFGVDVAVAFWAELLKGNERVTSGGVVIDLESFGRERDPDELVRAFTILIDRGEGVVPTARQRPCTEGLREKFLQSSHRAIHKALFDLADRLDNVWLEGGRNYGLRVAHRCKHGSVSLVRSRGTGQLLIGQPR